MNSKFLCRHCRDYHRQGKKTFMGFCSDKCKVEWAVEFNEKKREKAFAKIKADVKKKEVESKRYWAGRKAAIKPTSKHLAEAQSAVNLYVRLRDYHEPCISCQKSRLEVEAEQGWKAGGCFDAGHFKTRGAKPQLRFVLFNIHKQCKKCNGGSGKFSHKAATVDANYRIHLIEKIGIEKVEWLDNNNEPDLMKKDIEYLVRVKRIFRKRARFYKKRLELSST